MTEPGITNTTIKNKYVRKKNDFSSAKRHPHTVTGSALDTPGKNLSATGSKLHLPQLLLSRSVGSDSLWPRGLQLTGSSVLLYLPGFAQTHIHGLSDAFQPSHPLPPSSPFAVNLSHHQRLFQGVGSSHPVMLGASLSFPSDEYSGLISFRIVWFDLLAAPGTLESSSGPQFESINFSARSLLNGPILTFVHDYWKSHRFDYTQSDVSAF